MTDTNGRRVVITGRGAVTPLGHTWPETWQGLVDGRSGARALSTVDTTDMTVRIGGEVLGFDPVPLLGAKVVRRTDRSIHLALAAAIEAAKNAKVDRGTVESSRLAVVFGSAGGPTRTNSGALEDLASRGPVRISPYVFPSGGVDSAASEIALWFGAQGLCNTVVTACATGTSSIGEAARLIRTGEADVVITGGADDTMTRLDISCAAVSRALSRRNDDPAGASRPFDRDRDGFVMSAGAGAIVLESEAHAENRGAHVYAELAGFGATTDAFHMTAPSPEGGPALRAMGQALRQAGLAPEEIGYVNAHGTSTRLNDTTEIRLIRNLFGEHAPRIPVSSIKSMTGHMMGGSGAVEVISSIDSIETGIVPPTLNCDNPEAAELNFVPNTAQEHRVDSVMSNSFGFGGHNAVVVLRRWRR